MNSSDQLLATARARGADQPYAGAVTPQEAYQLLQMNPATKLVDVRTFAERHWVGQVSLPASQHVAIEWSFWPGGATNPNFAEQLQEVAGKDDVLLFLCRSGVRSRHAARLATEQGFTNAFDILEGFEGDKDGAGHRKHVAGWCKAGLPWIGG
jgi:rhodanese-related sulfurtransferase